MKIAVTKETRFDEKRVSIVPEIAKRFIDLEAEVVVEKDAGKGAGFSDEAYRARGAIIAYDKTLLYQEADIVSWVKRPEREIEELRYIPSNSMIVGFLDPLKPGNHLQHFARKRVTAISLELLPHNRETERMNAFSIMGKFAGQIAYRNALNTLIGKTHIKIKVFTILIIGSGNVGMAAAEKAHQDGNKVIVVSTNHRYQVVIEEKLAGVFVLLANEPHQVLTEHRQQEQLREVISEHQPDIIIAAARRYGQKSPQLITNATIEVMKPGTVIEDLTASLGGNTLFTKPDQEIKLSNNVSIRNKSNYPSQNPTRASECYANCLWYLLKHVITQTRIEPNYNVASDPLLSKTVITHEGKLCLS